MAQGYNDFTAGAVLTAADLEDYCQNQTVMRFATTAARDTALSSVKTEGMLAYSVADDTTHQYDGTNWVPVITWGAWTSYTPTLGGTGAALGNGTLTGAYQKHGRTIRGRISLIHGTTTNMSSSGITFTVPATIGNLSASQAAGTALMESGSSRYPGAVYAVSTDVLVIYAFNASSTYASMSSVTTAVPITWASGDVLYVSFRYEADN